MSKARQSGTAQNDWTSPDSVLAHSLAQISGLEWLLVVVVRPTSYSTMYGPRMIEIETDC